jgi:hypothetical protein
MCSVLLLFIIYILLKLFLLTHSYPKILLPSYVYVQFFRVNITVKLMLCKISIGIILNSVQ